MNKNVVLLIIINNSALPRGSVHFSWNNVESILINFLRCAEIPKIQTSRCYYIIPRYLQIYVGIIIQLAWECLNLSVHMVRNVQITKSNNLIPSSGETFAHPSSSSNCFSLLFIQLGNE